MVTAPAPRLAVVCVLLALLGGTTVWHGAIPPDPEQNNYPGADDVVTDREAFVDQRVSLGGEIVSTDPIVIEIDAEPHGTFEVTLEGTGAIDTARGDLVVGNEVRAHGTLTDADTLAVESGFVRQPWETLYMYAVSFVAGLWVLGRFLHGWRLDRATLSFSPRETDAEGR
ncbi:hypothetical protein ACNS7O_02195 [Haloferacaceae archaeon DSL9]